MSSESINRLAHHARDELGRSLRTVAVVYDDDFEVVYLRDDLKELYTKDSYANIVDSFRDIPAAQWGSGKESPIGKRKSVVYCHENAFVFQFGVSGCHSVLMSVEPDVGTKLRTFIDDCQQRF
jgi:hypothetical protein